MSNKQYYNNINPGETSIESRTGAKIVMNDGLVINAARRPEYLDQLRKDNYQGNIKQNVDEDTSFVSMGKIPVDIKQQGNVNQESILENKESKIITPTRTSGEMPDEEIVDPPILLNIYPLKGKKGDEITIEGFGFIKYATQVTFGGVSADSVGFFSGTRIIAIVGNGKSGDIVVKVKGASTTYKDKFTYLGVEEGFEFEQRIEDDPTDTSTEGNNLPDGKKSNDEKGGGKPPEGCPKSNQTRSAANVKRVIKPCEGAQGVARDNLGKIVPIYDFVAAAKTCIDISTGCPPITQNGKLGCAMGVSIIYMYACGHGMTWVNTKNAKPIVGTYLQYAFGTALIYDYLSKDKLNFEKIEIYKPGQGIDYWKNTSMKLLQPGDIVDTITVATRNGHIGVVSDTQNNRPGTWDIISNSSSGYNPLLGVKIGTIKSNYNTYSWGSGVATRSGVGPTYIFRFKCGRGATWGKTLGIPQT
jgi:hypothetical protein